jgi:hypothetical protein
MAAVAVTKPPGVTEDDEEWLYGGNNYMYKLVNILCFKHMPQITYA